MFFNKINKKESMFISIGSHTVRKSNIVHYYCDDKDFIVYINDGTKNSANISIKMVCKSNEISIERKIKMDIELNAADTI